MQLRFPTYIEGQTTSIPRYVPILPLTEGVISQSFRENGRLQARIVGRQIKCNADERCDRFDSAPRQFTLTIRRCSAYMLRDPTCQLHHSSRTADMSTLIRLCVRGLYRRGEGLKCTTEFAGTYRPSHPHPND